MRLSIVAGLAWAMALVLSPAIASADFIKLSTGEVLNVKITGSTDTTITFVHPVLGEITVPRSNVEILPEPPAEVQAADAAPAAAAPQATEAQAAAAEPAPPPAPPAEPPPKEWKFKFVAGAGLATGNSENANVNAILTAIRELPETKLSLDTAYFYAESDHEASTNRFTIGGRHDWLNPGSKWFFFADARYDWDDFQSWDSRVNAHVGIGYRIFEPPKFKLNALGGIGFVREFGSDNEDFRPEALAGFEGQYDFAEKHSIVFSTIVYPDLNDLGEFRWVNSLAYAILLDQATNLSLTAGLQHEYQSVVDEDRDKNDLRLFAGLQLEF